MNAPSPPTEQRPTLPSWLISTVLHALLLVAVALGLRLGEREGAAPERTAEVGIVLTHREDSQDFFEGPESNADAAANAQSDTSTDAANSASSLDDLVADSPSVDPSDALPEAAPRLGPGDLEGGGVDAAGAAAGPEGGRTSRAPGGRARTRIFGVEGEGYKFVYVFDRSASMSGSPLEAAKAQLLASLNSLEETHQFQIIFYNERPWKFNPTGDPNRMLFATERNKKLAARFVGGITADGATRHEAALLDALRLGPDVIFFLTDADEPKLYPSDLARIGRRAAGITINCIEFGIGPRQDAANFLVRLARENGGGHAYVDTTRLKP